MGYRGHVGQLIPCGGFDTIQGRLDRRQGEISARGVNKGETGDGAARREGVLLDGVVSDPVGRI